MMTLTACTDELSSAGGSIVPGEGEGVVTLSVPGTRAVPTTGESSDTDATADERSVSELWFLAYPAADEGEALVQQLRTDELEHDSPRIYNLRMKYGDYRIYVVANVPGIDLHTTEDELKAIMLHYTGEDGETLILPDPNDGGLPMFFQHEGTFTVSEAGGTIRAQLEFCCVKVRYTLWFDNNSFSESTFGNSYVRINAVAGQQIATTVPLIPTGQTIEGMTLLDTEENALNGKYADGEYSESEHESLTFTSDEPQNNNQWAYRATFYLPEHYVTDNKEQSLLSIKASLYDAQGAERSALAYTIELGEVLSDASGDTETASDLRQLPRGRYYDITGKITGLGNQLESTVAVQDWTPQSVDTELESPYHLWVEKTVIESLIAGQEETFRIRTDAPRLQIGQGTTTITNDAGEQIFRGEPFVITLNQNEAGEYISVTVKVNPLLPPNTIIPERHRFFSINIIDPETNESILRKQINITSLSTVPYFNVTPPEYVISISDIANETTHAVRFTYETNMTDVEVQYNGSDVTSTGITANNPNITLTNSGLENGTGTVTVTLNEPNVPAHFPGRETLTLDYTATDSRDQSLQEQEQTFVTIVPNAQTYRLHFRPVDDSWTNPHIYVYEPLYAPDGTEVRITGGSGIVYEGQVKDFYGTAPEYLGENALQYSFTGKRTFLGWQNQGGSVAQPNSYYINSNQRYWDGDYFSSLKFLQFDGTNNSGASSKGAYSWDIDYVASEFRTACNSCQLPNPKGYNSLSSTADGYNFKWPGVAMKSDPENPGWFYFDLPVLAKPNTTLIMFADGHNGNNDPQDRYPAHMVPGVPLYNFADKEGWFLYDWNESDKNEFVDDKPNNPEIETLSNVSQLPDGTYRIYARRMHFWLWDGGINYSQGAYPGEDQTATTIGKDGDNPYYYYIDMVVDRANRPNWTPGNVSYNCSNNGGNPIESSISISDWKRVKGSSYYYYIVQ